MKNYCFLPRSPTTINTGRVEMIDSTDYNTSWTCEVILDEDGDGANVGDDVDDDLDDSCDDGDDDGDDLPFREVFSPVESSRRRCLFSSVGFRHGAAAELRKLSVLGFLEYVRFIGQKVEPGVAPRVQEPSRRGQGGGRA